MTERPAAPLLKTKLFMPPLRHEAVQRPRLTARLDAGLRCALTLISAPAGFGKTTALLEWAGRLAARVAWLSLDEGDNDAARFCAYLVAALQTVLPGIGDPALAALRSPQPPLETVLTGLINEIAAETGPLVLILDDYHTIRTPAIHDAVAFLIDHLPAPLRLVIATRADPPLPLARLRSRGQLAELRAADLRFTPDEAASFLNQAMGLGLSAADAAALEVRTEGWIAGLQLAALSLQGRQDASAFIAAFSGSHHFILDYLTEEVLRRQPPDVQTFLLCTSILDRLCGPLCDALLEDRAAPAQGTLEQLERQNMFIVPLDDERRWYRYHHLFADLLHSQLLRLHASRVPELHRRASLWHEQHGLTAEAVRHALQAGDGPRAAGLVEANGWPLLIRGEMMTVLGWLEALPEEQVRARPWLCIYHAWVLVMTGRLDAVEPRLQDAARNLLPSTGAGREMLGHLAAIRAYAASQKSDAAGAITFAHEALECLPEHDLPVRSVVSYTLGVACLLADDVAGACQALAEAGRLGRASGNIHMAVPALCGLAGEQMVLGRLRQAQETLQALLPLTAGREGRPLPLAARVYSELSELHYEWNDLEAATRYAEESIKLGSLWGNTEAWTRAPLALAQALLAQGDTDGAYAALRKVDAFVRVHDTTASTIARVEACRAQLWLANIEENMAAAADWAEARASLLQPDMGLPLIRQREHLALARVLIALGRHGDALGLLARLRTAAEAGGHAGHLIKIRVLEALAHRAQGELKQALAAIEQALALAEPEGYVRTFLDESAPMAELLAGLSRDWRSPHAGYVRRLLAAFGIEVDSQQRAVRLAKLDASTWAEPLSTRELEVLRLMAAGLSNGEIAGRLVVAVSTVKRHINHIFSKLGATSRTQAIVRARERGLL